jgi:glycosyltransferase involved in cell wall biosynthesis
METLANTVWQVLKDRYPEALLLAYGGSNRGLIRWLPKAAWILFLSLRRKSADFVLIGDAATYAFLYPVLRFARVRHATMVMGLDLTFHNRIYRAVAYRTIRRAPRVIAISEATADTAREIGVPADAIRVIRPGLPVPPFVPHMKSEARTALAASLSIDHDSVLALSLGRLVKRKGVTWFVLNVLPRTDARVHYVVAGMGPEFDVIKKMSERAGVANRVHLLGSVDDALRDRLLYGCDMLVQPNILVPNDVEGFGLVMIEATLRGTPVLAAGLQGIKDAVVDGVTGQLLPSGADSEWVRMMNEWCRDRQELASLGQRFRARAIELYSQERMGRELLNEIVITPGAHNS